MGEMFFDGWESLLRTLIVGVLAYCALVVFLRIAGKASVEDVGAVILGTDGAFSVVEKGIETGLEVSA